MLTNSDVTISAYVSGSSDLVDMSVLLDGQRIGPNPGQLPVRNLSFSTTLRLETGEHEVRVEARDEHGQRGGYRWQFSVGQARAPRTTPTAAPVLKPEVPPVVRPAGTASPPAKPGAP